MKAISIKQPWAWAILHAGKDVENRTWKTDYRGQILIHASKKFDQKGYEWLEENKSYLFPDIDLPAPGDFLTGGVVGKAILKRLVRSKDYSPWMFGPWGFVFEDPEPIEFKPCPGRLGIFELGEM